MKMIAWIIFYGIGTMTKTYERLFFALWPDDELRSKINSTYETFSDIQKKGRRVPLYNLHLTLHFLGNIPLDEVDCYIEKASEVKVKPFELSINHRGYFKKPRIVWLGLEQVPEGLVNLQQRLGQRISDCGFNPDKRLYNPHITVTRKISQNPGSQVVQPIPWEVNRFVLVISEPVDSGVRYRVKTSYPLVS